MAARENQGLQIALIVFVMLTIMLSVSTFLFFRNYQSEQQKAKTAEDTTATTKQSLASMQNERDLFIQFIGFPATEKKETVEETFAKELAVAATLGVANLPEDQKNYRKLVDTYEALARTQHSQLAQKDENIRTMKTSLDTATAQYESEKKKLTDEKDQTVAAYAAEQKKIQDQNLELVKTKNELIAEKEAKTKEFDELKAKAETEINSLKEKLLTAEDKIRRLNEVNTEVTGVYNVNAAPDGRIVWVNQRAGTAVINLGSADNLRKRITFSVFDPGTTDVSASTKPDKSKVSTPASAAVNKGSIEVINITDNHMAECRILQHSPANPILPGDVIYTPVWQPGQQDHFALAGTLDIDGDGQDDTRRVQELIQLNGGAVDNEITVNTRYVVVGKVDEASDKSEATFKALGDAKKFGIQQIKLSQFLEMMGYAAKAVEGSFAAGEGMRYPNAGEPTARFRPRNPPPRGKIGSAY